MDQGVGHSTGGAGGCGTGQSRRGSGGRLTGPSAMRRPAGRRFWKRNKDRPPVPTPARPRLVPDWAAGRLPVPSKHEVVARRQGIIKLSSTATELTGVRGHGFLLGKAAVRAGQHGFKNDGTHRVLTIATPLVVKRNGHHHGTAAQGERQRGVRITRSRNGSRRRAERFSAPIATWGRGRPASAPARAVAWLVLWDGPSVVGAPAE